MQAGHPVNEKGQRGVALIIALFAIMLISALGMGLVLTASTETGITANYKLYTQAHYAAMAGVHEGRARMISGAPDFCCATPVISPFDNVFKEPPLPPFTTLPIPTPVLYILNPAAGETVDPKSGPYEDKEVGKEFPSGVEVITLNSNQIGTGTATALPYKWVRITPKTEFAVGMDLDGSGGDLDKANAVYLQTPPPGDPRLRQNLWSNMPVLPWYPVIHPPVWLITALSVLPNGTTQLLQIEAAQPPKINSDGAIDSKADVTLNGNFTSLGTYCKSYLAPDPCNPLKEIELCVNGIAQCYDCTDKGVKLQVCAPPPTKDFCGEDSNVPGVKTEGTMNTPGPTQFVQGNATGPNPNYQTNQPFPYNLETIIQAYTPFAQPITDFPQGSACTYGNSCVITTQMGKLPNYPSTYTCPDGTKNTNPPFPCFGQKPPYNDEPVTVFANMGPGKELKMKAGTSGSGILLVNGDLTVEGGFKWFGQIIVTGKLTFLGGGADQTNIYGSVIAGENAAFDNTTTGGTMKVIYSSCAIRTNQHKQALNILAFREK